MKRAFSLPLRHWCLADSAVLFAVGHIGVTTESMDVRSRHNVRKGWTYRPAERPDGENLGSGTVNLC